jgi:hypothetical protein
VWGESARPPARLADGLHLVGARRVTSEEEPPRWGERRLAELADCEIPRHVVAVVACVGARRSAAGRRLSPCEWSVRPWAKTLLRRRVACEWWLVWPGDDHRRARTRDERENHYDTVGNGGYHEGRRRRTPDE